MMLRARLRKHKNNNKLMNSLPSGGIEYSIFEPNILIVCILVYTFIDTKRLSRFLPDQSTTKAHIGALVAYCLEVYKVALGVVF
ncbi:hypothetical protein, partial [Marinomonas primoryensis]